MVERLFYDGHCGLCHRSVLFVLRHDPDGRLFHFAPLGGETFLSELTPEQRQSLPDSMVVRTAEGRVLVRSRATLHILSRLGGFWRFLARLLLLVPRPLADAGYDLVARVRKRIFASPADACPLVPLTLRTRFAP